MLSIVASPNPVVTVGPVGLLTTFDGVVTLLEVLDNGVSRGALVNPVSPLTWSLTMTQRDIGPHTITAAVTRAGGTESTSISLPVNIPLSLTVAPHDNLLVQQGTQAWLRDLLEASTVVVAPLQNGSPALWLQRNQDQKREKLAVYSSLNLGSVPNQFFTAEGWADARAVPPQSTIFGIAVEPATFDVWRQLQREAVDVLTSYIDTGKISPFTITLGG